MSCHRWFLGGSCVLFSFFQCKCQQCETISKSLNSWYLMIFITLTENSNSANAKVHSNINTYLLFTRWYIKIKHRLWVPNIHPIGLSWSVAGWALPKPVCGFFQGPFKKGTLRLQTFLKVLYCSMQLAEFVKIYELILNAQFFFS